MPGNSKQPGNKQTLASWGILPDLCSREWRGKVSSLSPPTPWGGGAPPPPPPRPAAPPGAGLGAILWFGTYEMFIEKNYIRTSTGDVVF